MAEFGTNTGRQGTFDASNEEERSFAMQRLQALHQTYGNVLDNNFTGITGLASNDRQGYSDLLNARTEATNIGRLLQDQGPLKVEIGQRFGGPEAPSTLFDSEQSSAITGRTFGQEQALQALKREAAFKASLKASQEQ